MKTTSHQTIKSIIAGVCLIPFIGSLHAWEPNVKDLDAALNSGEFAPYNTNLRDWLVKKAPADAAKITHPALTALLQNATVAPVLAQYQFINKVGVGQLSAFAKADPANKEFLSWVMKNRNVMELLLEGATPVRIAARDDNSWSISTNTLDIWKKIRIADPDSKDGVYLRLAMATALRPPGTGSPGSGQQKTPSDPVVRYKYFKNAHANKELFPSFDKLTVWDYQFVVNSGASEADLTWGREMVNTWNPTFKINEKVVDTTSCVWRRNSRFPTSTTKPCSTASADRGRRGLFSSARPGAFRRSVSDNLHTPALLTRQTTVIGRLPTAGAGMLRSSKACRVRNSCRAPKRGC